MQGAQHLVYEALVVRQPVELVQGWRDVVTHVQSSDDREIIVLGSQKITQRSSSLILINRALQESSLDITSDETALIHVSRWRKCLIFLKGRRWEYIAHLTRFMFVYMLMVLSMGGIQISEGSVTQEPSALRQKGMAVFVDIILVR